VLCLVLLSLSYLSSKIDVSSLILTILTKWKLGGNKFFIESTKTLSNLKDNLILDYFDKPKYKDLKARNSLLKFIGKNEVRFPHKVESKFIRNLMEEKNNKISKEMKLNYEFNKEKEFFTTWKEKILLKRFEDIYVHKI